HSKKSPHLHPAHGQKWRRTLCETLAGSPQRVHRCLAALNMPRVGIVTSRSHLAEGSDSNAPNVRALLGRTGVHDFDTHGTWAAGTMFWARSEILRFWKRMEICQSDFEPEPYAVDGFLGHAWERAVSPHARAALGLETVGI
ncbi:MAG: rhamnan synthesis F family protein, partial [Verrucomicrobiota bacterium]